jgi:hypothetical protein
MIPRTMVKAGRKRALKIVAKRRPALSMMAENRIEVPLRGR